MKKILLAGLAALFATGILWAAAPAITGTWRIVNDLGEGTAQARITDTPVGGRYGLTVTGAGGQVTFRGTVAAGTAPDTYTFMATPTIGGETRNGGISWEEANARWKCAEETSEGVLIRYLVR